MVHLTIDNRPVEVPPGTTILDAASSLGIEIPTLCHLPGRPAATSCMVCLVKIDGQEAFSPACATVAQDGMVVESQTDCVRRARRAALELLLSDHLGDCMGPCQVTCPAGMDIPRMIRQIAAGALREAIATVKRDIALPAVLGRICPAPCERVCRRGQADTAVAICLLKRYVADADLAAAEPYLPACQPPSGKRVAIVGAGPAGLAAAFHLLQFGHACTVLDDRDHPGGMLRTGSPPDRLPPSVLDAEIQIIARLGAEFRTGTRVGRDVPLEELRQDFDAVLVAAGKLDADGAKRLGLRLSGQAVEANRTTFATDQPGLFAAGNAIRPANRMAVRSLADGKAAAASIDQYLRDLPVTGPERPFNTRIGRLLDGEIEQFFGDASRADRLSPARGEEAGFANGEAREEARRCLHCDCCKADRCKLRDYSAAYGARARQYTGQRRAFVQHREHAEVIYEPGKCIACGLCIRIAEEHSEPLGLTFIGRGFDVRVGVPLNRTLAEGLRTAAAQCVAACPTGALALKANA